MKTNIFLKSKLLVLGGLLAIVLSSVLLIAGKSPSGYVAHEWGTFTSVQGGDGALLEWRPLETSRLPDFVYNWNHPGLNRQPTGGLGPKSGVVTLQRMETPIIYFYSAEAQNVDVSVQFPQGFITEWYPQAAQVGPSAVPVPPIVAKMDTGAHKVGVSPAFTFASFLPDRPVKESRIRWANIEILPQKEQRALAGALPFDRSGSHYFAARETDANYLHANSLSATNPAPETEKFIFYRGVGRFGTPLRVTMASDSEAILANTGAEPLEHLFLLNVHQGQGSFRYVERVRAGEQRHIELNPNADALSRDKVAAQLGVRIAESLVKAGLYPREAKAMVKTWTDSWFAEDGTRVLYILPRRWTDATLPLALDPAPRELVRVMVGRAEIILPSVQQQLTEQLKKASAGDDSARTDAINQFRRLGRFGEPAVRLVLKQAPGQIVSQTGWELLQSAAIQHPTVANTF